MGSWSYKNLGASATKATKGYIEQTMKCLGIDMDAALYESEAGIIDYHRFSPQLMGEATLVDVTPLELFCLLNKLFGNTYVYYEFEEGSNTSDWYYREEEIYDPTTKKIYRGLREYCYGDSTVFGKSVYVYLKEEIEKQAEKRGITISWIGEGFDLKPDWENDEFYDLCGDIKCEKGLGELGTKQHIEDIKTKEIKKSISNTLVEQAKGYGYTELLAIIQEKLVDCK